MVLAMAEAVTVIGLDHIYLTVSDVVRSEAFYDPVMQALGFRKGDKPIAGERHAHYFCPVLQISLRPARSPRPHDPYAPGLHHLCLQLPDRTQVDAAYRSLRELGVPATEPALYPEYNPDHYATFFQDPDGLRLELVTRTPYRDALTEEWSRYRHFLNPRAAFEGERTGVFHIASVDEWDAARRAGEHRPGSLEKEGFVHCSTRAQVLATAERHFAEREDLVLLRLDARRLEAALRYEAPRPPIPDQPGALFPHLYAPLPVSAVVAAHRLLPGPDGRFAWPEGEDDGDSAVDDISAGDDRRLPGG